MLKYIIKRLLLLIPVVFGITFIIFVVLNLAPGDPAAMILGQDATAEALAAKRAEMGLDQPIVIQYIRYIAGVLRGDFGTSWLSGYEVLPEFLHRIPYTILLGSLSMFVAVIIGIPLGIIAAIRQYHFVDYASLALALILFSLPSFWFAMMGQILFCLTLGWLPAAGVGSLAHFILPSITLGANILASQLRMTRTSMLDVIKQDYIRTARAKGADERRVVAHRHAASRHTGWHLLCFLHGGLRHYRDRLLHSGHRLSAHQRSQGPGYSGGDGHVNFYCYLRGYRESDRGCHLCPDRPPRQAYRIEEVLI